MRDQARLEPYQESALFADGAAMQTPPPGTVSLESIAALDTAAPPVTRALLERGRDRYAIYCTPCHGARGNADTFIASRMTLRRPRSLLDPGVRRDPPGGVFNVITQGYGLMPSYARPLPVRDRWAVVAYVRALQLSQETALEALPAGIRAEALSELTKEAR